MVGGSSGPWDDPLRLDAWHIWRAGVQAVDPVGAVTRALGALDRASPFAPTSVRGRYFVVGAGKAGALMALAVESYLNDLGIAKERISGWVNVPAPAAVEVAPRLPLGCVHLHAARPAGVNEPTPAAWKGTQEILRLVGTAGPQDLVICVLSGGGSALLPAPAHGISLEHKLRVTQLLVDCGATIEEINAVRKHISQVKGGGLARHCPHARILSLIVSDVIGDPLDVIASGPTAPDPTTFAQALAVLARYGLEKQVPASVLDHLHRGARGEIAETLKELPKDDRGRPRVLNLVVASNRSAVRAAAAEASRRGYQVLDLGSWIAGDTQTAAQFLAMIALGVRQELCLGLAPTWDIDTAESQGQRSARPPDPMLAVPPPVPVAILSGGETTVRLPPEHGLGGRNQELALAFLDYLGERIVGITLLCGGTDGEDGPTDAAGAVADRGVFDAARARGLVPADFLARHDSYHFFAQLDALVKTGLTHTNVMDLRVILVRPVP
ncbi:MAG: glycerate kinase [Gemmataceae bacterium]